MFVLQMTEVAGGPGSGGVPPTANIVKEGWLFKRGLSHRDMSFRRLLEKSRQMHSKFFKCLTDLTFIMQSLKFLFFVYIFFVTFKWHFPRSYVKIKVGLRRAKILVVVSTQRPRRHPSSLSLP